MKPSEMSRDQLLAEWLMLFAHEMFGGLNTPPEFDEIATRLRNSIPKPVVDLDDTRIDYPILVNGRFIISDPMMREGVSLIPVRNALRTALGLEGGE